MRNILSTGIAAAAVLSAIFLPASSFSSEGSRIAFSTDRDGNFEVYVINSDGSEATNLTNNDAADFEPSWSPDGLRLAFESDRESPVDIFIMDADGSNQTNITNEGASYLPIWSPVGDEISFSSLRDGQEEIYIMNIDGSGQQNLTNNSANDCCGGWSPDGLRLAFPSRRTGVPELFVMNSDGSNVLPLTSDGAQVFTVPVWSPDGMKIAFTSLRDGNYEVYIMNADGSGQVNLSNNEAADQAPSWSPDGGKIAFHSNRDGNLEIYTMNADGSGQVNISQNAAFDCCPDWGRAAVPQIIQLDIKPGSSPNAIGPHNQGVIPVAILTSSIAEGDPFDFDAGDVDSQSLAFGPAGTGIAHRMGHITDVDGDGDLDLVVHFRTLQTGIACGDLAAILRGQTFGGLAIEGADSIVTVGCH